MHDETWRDIPGYEGLYAVSDAGRVKSIPRTAPAWSHKAQRMSVRTIAGCILKAGLGSHGYPTVNLTDHVKRENRIVGVLVLEAFIGPRPDGYVCRHIDGNKLNNNLNNIEWATQSRNMQDVKWHREPNTRNRKLQPDEVAEIKRLLPFTTSTEDLGKRFGVSGRTIRFIRANERHTDV